MIWFAIIPVLWFFMLRQMWYSTDKYDMLTWPTEFMGWAATAFGMFACALVGGLIAAAIAGMLGSVLDDAKIWHLEDRLTEQLVSVRDKDGIQGAIAGGLFMIAGYVESRPYYFYYTQDKDGVIHPEKISISRSVYIHEMDDNSEPRYVEKQWDNGRPWLDLFAFTSGGWQYHFYVPKGTVRRDMTM